MHNTVKNLLDIQDNIETHLNKLNVNNNPKIIAVSKTFKIDKIFKEMVYMLKRNKSLNEQDIKTVIDLIDVNVPQGRKENSNNVIFHGERDIIRARTPRQVDYLEKVNKNDLVFPISDKNVALIIKKHALVAGLDYKKYAGHSLRSGFATTTAELGASERNIMAMTGHKSVDMVRRYIKEADLFKNNALNKISNK